MSSGGRCHPKRAANVKKSLLLAGLASLLALFLVPTGAAASQPEPRLVLGFQPQATTGERLVLSAYLMDPAGNPISDQPVSFSMDAEFMNVLGDVRIGQATTDQTGLAAFVYEAKSEGNHTVSASFAGNQVFLPANAANPLTVQPGTPTFVEPQPFRIPGANISTLVLALGTVWGLYLVVGLYFWAISRPTGQSMSKARVAR